MKHETKATDLEKIVTAVTARRQADAAKTRATAAIAREIDGTAQAGSSAYLVAAAITAAHSARAAELALSRLPKDRRTEGPQSRSQPQPAAASRSQPQPAAASRSQPQPAAP